MPSASPARPDGAKPGEVLADHASAQALRDSILVWLDDAKAEDVVSIDLKGKSTIADFMVVASGRNDRHVAAIGEQVQRKLKETGHGRARAEGMDQCDWVLIDAGSVILHVFRPEVRDFYKLERMWSESRPPEGQSH